MGSDSLTFNGQVFQRLPTTAGIAKIIQLVTCIDGVPSDSKSSVSFCLGGLQPLALPLTQRRSSGWNVAGNQFSIAGFFL